MSENYYQILGIPSDADERQIKRAYHKLARELHPDKATTPEQGKDFEQKFAEVSKAYNALKDSASRAEYDRKAPLPGPAGQAAPGASRTPTSAVMNAPRPAAPASAGKPASNGSGKPPSSPGMGVSPERANIAQKAYLKGLKYLKENDPSKAAEFFEAAIANNEMEPSYHAKLAMAMIDAKKSASRAIQAAQRAIDLDKYNLDYRFTLAQIYNTIGSKTNAVKIYEEILKWDAENEMAKQMLRTLTKKTGLFAGLSNGGNGLFSGFRRGAGK